MPLLPRSDLMNPLLKEILAIERAEGPIPDKGTIPHLAEFYLIQTKASS